MSALVASIARGGAIKGFFKKGIKELAPKAIKGLKTIGIRSIRGLKSTLGKTKALPKAVTDAVVDSRHLALLDPNLTAGGQFNMIMESIADSIDIAGIRARNYDALERVAKRLTRALNNNASREALVNMLDNARANETVGQMAKRYAKTGAKNVKNLLTGLVQEGGENLVVDNVSDIMLKATAGAVAGGAGAVTGVQISKKNKKK